VAASDSVGNLMQSFRAAAYRGKTVRLRAWVRVEAGGPGDRAQMWLRVDRPNGKVGFLEDMDGRPVRAAEWTSCEIVAEIDSDAEFVDFGVRSMGRGRVWVDEVSFDIVPEEQVTAVRNAIARIYARTDATLAAFRFSGTEAVATARKATQQGGFTLVELSRDTWTRGEDGWELTEHVALSRGYETAAPDPETVRAVAEDLKQYRARWRRAAMRCCFWRQAGRRRTEGGSLAGLPSLPDRDFAAEGLPALVEFGRRSLIARISPWTRRRAARDTEVYGEVRRRDLPQREG
jgi:hypothetical protein